MRYDVPFLTLVGEAKGVVLGGMRQIAPDSHKPDIEFDSPNLDWENWDWN
jgi:hypothetical protein